MPVLDAPIEEAGEVEIHGENVPAGSDLVDVVVDVSKNGKRLGTGVVRRDDVEPPYRTEIVMVTPPFMKGKVIREHRGLTYTRCATQQVKQL